MRVRFRAWSAVAMLICGCARPAEPPVRVMDPELPPETTQAPMTLRLAGREVLTFVPQAGTPVGNELRLYSVLKPPTPATAPARSGPELFWIEQSIDLNAARRIRCELAAGPEDATATLTLSARQPLPDISLLATVAPGLEPVRLAPGEQPLVIQTAVGPASQALLDGLRDPHTGFTVAVDGLVTFGGVDGREACVSLGEDRGEEATILSLSLRSSGSPASQPATQPATRAAASQPAPAGWMDIGLAGPERPARITANLQWLTRHLRAWRLAGIWTRSKLVTESAAKLGLPVSESPAGGPQTPAEARAIGGFNDRYARFRERGERYNWQHAKELMAPVVQACNIDGPGFPGPIRIGEPLSIEHARLWVTLLGLSGQAAALADDLAELPAERAEMLRRILPPAPVRCLDLFPHAWPETWNLQVADPSGVWNVVALLNWTPERSLRRVHLPSLGIAAEPGISFAVYDLWRRQLLAITDDAFDVPLLPTSCRLASIRPLMHDGPTLLAAGNHLAGAGTTLDDLLCDGRRRILSGTVDLAAGEPCELVFCVPPGEESFEITAVSAAGAAATLRRDGLLRVLSLLAEQNAAVPWRIEWAGAAQQTAPPAAPALPTAQQNTRGVLLTWLGRDERAVLYHVYRDGEHVGLTAEPAFQDSTVPYDRQCTYAIAALDYAGRESPRSPAVIHRTPVPASSNLTDLVPLMIEQEHLAPAADTSVGGNPMRVAGRRYHRGLGLHSNARVRYFLGGGYETFSGEVGIDDETEGKGSCVFEVIVDGETLFTSGVLRGGVPPQPFSVRVRDRMVLELVVTDGGDQPDNDHANWGNPYLQARVR